MHARICMHAPAHTAHAHPHDATTQAYARTRLQNPVPLPLPHPRLPTAGPAQPTPSIPTPIAYPWSQNSLSLVPHCAPRTLPYSYPLSCSSTTRSPPPLRKRPLMSKFRTYGSLPNPFSFRKPNISSRCPVHSRVHGINPNSNRRFDPVTSYNFDDETFRTFEETIISKLSIHPNSHHHAFPDHRVHGG